MEIFKRLFTLSNNSASSAAQLNSKQKYVEHLKDYINIFFGLVINSSFCVTS